MNFFVPALAGLLLPSPVPAPVPTYPCHATAAGPLGGRMVVGYVDETGVSGLGRAVDLAVAAMNAGLSKVLLLPAEAWSVRIVASAAAVNPTMRMDCAGSLGRAVVTLPTSVTSARVEVLMVMHELGHALGLAHSPEPCALMHANDADCPRIGLIRFTPEESRTVDALYS